MRNFYSTKLFKSYESSLSSIEGGFCKPKCVDVKCVNITDFWLLSVNSLLFPVRVRGNAENDNGEKHGSDGIAPTTYSKICDYLFI